VAHAEHEPETEDGEPAAQSKLTSRARSGISARNMHLRPASDQIAGQGTAAAHRPVPRAPVVFQRSSRRTYAINSALECIDMRKSLTFAAIVLCVGLVLAFLTRPGQAGDIGTAPTATVTIGAEDFRFDAPAQIAAGPTTFRLVNNGTLHHHVFIVRLDEGRTVADLEAALARQHQLPAWAKAVGGPNAVDPGGTASATVNLRAGTYAMLCIIPDKDHVLHAMKGMTHTFEVTPAPRDADLPKSDLLMTLSDYDFQLSAPLTPGRHEIRVVNKAGQLHELVIFRLLPGRTQEDLQQWLGGMMQGPPPAEAVGGVSPLDNGYANTFTMDVEGGTYIFICFMPDVKDEQPHFVHGMIKAYTVE
jgi:hypothetical protein